MKTGIFGFSHDQNKNFVSWIRKEPKTQLHLHLEGSIPYLTLLSLSKKYQEPVQKSLVKRTNAKFHCNNFSDISESYKQITSLIRQPEDLILLISSLASHLRAQGVNYAELTVTPYIHVVNGWNIGALLYSLEQGRVQANLEGGPEIVWIFDFPRNIKDAEKITLDSAILGKEYGVFGIGLAGLENDYPPSMFKDTFQTAISAGLRSIIHAGETTGPEYIWEAITDLQAYRIGHGLSSINDPYLVKYLVKHQIPIEICPTSNLRMGLVNNNFSHPLRKLWDLGIFCTINSDDDLLFSTNIINEYLFIMQNFGFTLPEIKELIKNGYKAKIKFPLDIADI